MQKESVYLCCWLAFFLMANPSALIHPPLIWCFPLPPHLPSSLEPKGSWQRQKGFGTHSHMNFSFTSTSQLSPPLLSSPSLLSLAHSLHHWQVLSAAQAAIVHLVWEGQVNKKKQVSKQWDAGAHSHAHTHSFVQQQHVAYRQSKQLLDCSTWVCLFACLFFQFFFFFIAILLLRVPEAGEAEKGQGRAEESLLQRTTGANSRCCCRRWRRGERSVALRQPTCSLAALRVTILLIVTLFLLFVLFCFFVAQYMVCKFVRWRCRVCCRMQCELNCTNKRMS